MAGGNSVSPAIQEKRWREEDDARTLAQAAEIGADKKRMTGAQKAAGRMLKEQEQRAANLRKVANKPAVKKK